MAARFPHQAFANVIVVFAKVTTLLKHRVSGKRGQTIDDDAQWFTTSVHINGGDPHPHPLFRRLPVTHWLIADSTLDLS
jgi:hypothetical protein